MKSTETGVLLNRRSLMLATAGAAALGAGAHFAFPARAAADPAPQAPGYFRFPLGAFQITVVSDGNLTTPATMLGSNADRGEVSAFLEERFLDTDVNYAHTNHAVIDTGAKKILIDVGSGDKFQDSAGKLLEAMDFAGFAPEDIDIVVTTHAHPDHCWGMMDDFGDEPRFPNAEHMIMATEFDWWMAEGRVESFPDPMKPFAVGAQNALRPVAEQTKMLKDGDEIAPGVRIMATPGHTVGHASVIVESDDAALMITGDAINHAHVSFEHPEWHFGFDADPEQAVATRKKMLDMAAEDRMLVLGYHLPFPGVGHCRRNGEHYLFAPVVWKW